jgi:hypothetical protein
MSLSRRVFKTGTTPIAFDSEALGRALRAECPELAFALLMGSARDGVVPPGGDLDLAVSLDIELSLPLVERISAIAQRLAPGVEIDIGRFDRADPVYRFEALKGRLLFARNMGRFLDVYSLACREYETQMRDYERQARYRLERNGAAA